MSSGKPTTFRARRELPPPAPRTEADAGLAPMICPPLFEELTVLANGDIICSSSDVEGQRVYGNVLVDRIADVFEGPGYREMRMWQLESKPETWCPAIGEDCPRRVIRATPFDRPTGRSIRQLKLEPTTHCNLACPACPVVVNFPANPELFENRANRSLAVETMLDIVDQLPDLERILYFNYGEPFLNRGTIPFLRELKRRRPDVWVGTNTHGLALPPRVIAALADEVLIDKMVFSIDGAFPESYRKYRVGGELDDVLRNLRALVEARRRAGTEARLEIVWQYIFFEWNDTDEELTHAQELANEIGVPIQWVMTCTKGASPRVRHRSGAFAQLTDGADSFAAMHKPLQLRQMIANGGIAEGRYLAGIDVNSVVSDSPGPRVGPENGGAPVVTTLAGARVVFRLEIRNLAPTAWTPTTRDAVFRMGVRLHAPTGRLLRELAILHDEDGRYPFVPEAATLSNGVADLTVAIVAPDRPGSYRLLIDVVEQGVCWFHERGSTPLAVGLEVSAAADPSAF